LIAAYLYGMTSNSILAFSSSRVGSSTYLEKAIPAIHDLLGNEPLNIAFIPFALVKNDYDNYTSMVTEALSALPYTVNVVKPENAKAVIKDAQVIMVGGGNSFKLLHDIYQYQLLDIIRDKVDGGAPYIGWSAGANITGSTIGTTNDMPIIMPKSFNALGFLPFQINPHYNNFKPEGHNGETRDQRLEEFMFINPGLPVVALPEGTYLKLQNGGLYYFGDSEGYLFSNTEEETPSKQAIKNGEELSFLLY
jgi:dipeptidase E